MKKGIKINSDLQTLEYVMLGDDYQEIYPIIGEECRMFTCPIIFDNQDTMFVDDEGMFQNYNRGFIMDNWAYPIFGNALILGSDDEGESTDVQHIIEDFKGKIYFVEFANRTYKATKVF